MAGDPVKAVAWRARRVEECRVRSRRVYQDGVRAAQGRGCVPDRIAWTRGFVVLALAPCFAATGGSPAAAFEAVGLPRPDALSMDEVVPAQSYYALLEEMTLRAGDPQFPVRAGVALARSGLPVLVEARNGSQTLGECLLKIIAVFRQSVTNARYELSSDGLGAVLRLRRGVPGNALTSRVDTLNAAAFVTFFRDELGAGTLEGMTVSLPDPASMGREFLPPSAVLQSREGGMALSFPAAWLLRPLRGHWPGQAVGLRVLPGQHGRFQGVDFVRERIRARLALGTATLPAIAVEAGVSPRALQRLLRANGTGFRDMLAQERLRMARRLLATTRDPLGEIAQVCGFSSPQAMSRAFAVVFGQSPSAYRRLSGAGR